MPQPPRFRRPQLRLHQSEATGGEEPGPLRWCWLAWFAREPVEGRPDGPESPPRPRPRAPGPHRRGPDETRLFAGAPAGASDAVPAGDGAARRAGAGSAGRDPPGLLEGDSDAGAAGVVSCAATGTTRPDYPSQPRYQRPVRGPGWIGARDRLALLEREEPAGPEGVRPVPKGRGPGLAPRPTAPTQSC